MKAFHILLAISALCYAAIAVLSSNGSPINLIIGTNQRIIQVGKAIRINCSLGLSPNHTRENDAGDIQWYRNDEHLTGIRKHTLSASTSQMLVEKSQPADRGIYKCCLPFNCSDELKILIGSPPEPATDLHCSSTNFENFNCTWTRGGQRSNLTTRDVLLERDILTSGIIHWDVCLADQTICGADFCYLYFESSDCSKGDSYYKVESTNELGSVNSSEIRFKTTMTIPNAPFGVRINNESDSSLEVKWKRPRGIDIVHITKVIYCIEYHWEGHNETSFVNASRKSLILKNLTHPYGLYYVRVGSRGKYDQKKGCHKYSKWESARTSEKAPTDPPGSFTCEGSDPVTGKLSSRRNITLNWTPPPDTYMQNGVIRSYVITVRSVQERYPVANFTLGPNETSQQITDLSLRQHYTFIIRVQNSMGHSPPQMCEVAPITSQRMTIPLIITALVLISSAIIITVLFACYACRKKLPDLHVPKSIMEFNLPLRMANREQEVFDDLVTQGDGATVEQQLVSEAGSYDSDEDHAGFNPAHSHQERLLSAETCTTSITSGRSSIVFNEEISYARMTEIGLSPIDKDNRFESPLSSAQGEDIPVFSFEHVNCSFVPECDQETGHPKQSGSQLNSRAAENKNCDGSRTEGDADMALAKTSSGSSNVPAMLDSAPLKFREQASDLSPVIDKADGAAAKGSSIDALPSEYEKRSHIFGEQDLSLPTLAETNAAVNSEIYLKYITVAAASDDDKSLSTISETPHLTATVVKTENSHTHNVYIWGTSSGSMQLENRDNLNYVHVGLEKDYSLEKGTRI